MAGDIRYHHHFAAQQLHNERTLVVYLPPGYGAESNARYPVLYMHDGQNLFDAATSFAGVEWRADDTAERLIRQGRLRPLIIVGIYNTADRMNEYAVHHDEHHHGGGKGLLYARFVVEEVKPFIDRTYRTLPDRAHTAVAGSSLGGLISLHIARLYPYRFGTCAALSPSLFWANEKVFDDLRGDEAWLRRTRFWLDMGSLEGFSDAGREHSLALARRLVDRFDAAGLLPGRDYCYWEVTGGEHNEAAWAARFDKVLLYLFGQSPPGRPGRGGR